MTEQDENQLIGVTAIELRLLRKVAEKASDVLLSEYNEDFAKLSGGRDSLMGELFEADRELTEYLSDRD